MRGTNRYRPAGEGFALITVIWILAILSVIVLGFGHRALLRQMAARYELDHEQALMMARGAVQRGMAELANKEIFDLAEKRNPAQTDLGQHWARPVDLLREDGDFVSAKSLTKDTVTFSIEDCERRFNVNALGTDNGKQLLEHLKSIPRSVQRTLWVRLRGDGLNGSEIQFFQTVEELRALEGMSDAVWYGKDDQPGVRDLFDVYGAGLLNINTAPAGVLECLPDVQKGFVEAFIAVRNGADGIEGTADDQGFGSWDEVAAKVKGAPESTTALSRYCNFQSTCYKIRGVATRQGGKVRAVCDAVVSAALDEWTKLPRVLAWRESSIGSDLE